MAALAAAVPVAASEALPLNAAPDPLAALIAEYRREEEIFNATDAADGGRWQALRRLLETSPPAPTSLQGVLEANRLVIEEAEWDGCADLVSAVLGAVNEFIAGLIPPAGAAKA
ncbi:MAG: hypothetical protein HC829_02480 [Bacteroidales bacterium]|nr:hypothetical protein [Bacteroidales bacterium]